jgi:hypothetical protein
MPHFAINDDNSFRRACYGQFREQPFVNLGEFLGALPDARLEFFRQQAQFRLKALVLSNIDIGPAIRTGPWSRVTAIPW